MFPLVCCASPQGECFYQKKSGEGRQLQQYKEFMFQRFKLGIPKAYKVRDTYQFSNFSKNCSNISKLIFFSDCLTLLLKIASLTTVAKGNNFYKFYKELQVSDTEYQIPNFILQVLDSNCLIKHLLICFYHKKSVHTFLAFPMKYYFGTHKKSNSTIYCLS